MQFGVLRISTPLEHSGKPLVGRNPSFFFLPQMMFSIQLKKSSNNKKYKSLKKILENSVPFVRCQTIQRRWSSFWKPPRSCPWASALLQHIDILNMWRENHKGFNWYLQFLIKRLYSSFFLRVPVREYLVNGTPPFRKLRVGEWFVKFGPKLELMCFKNSVHLGAEKYLHVWNAGAKYFCFAGQWGEKNSLGKTWLSCPLIYRRLWM